MTSKPFDDAAPHIREAAYHLIRCWDALAAAEDELGEMIETTDISPLTHAIDDAAKAWKIEDDEIATWYEERFAHDK